MERIDCNHNGGLDEEEERSYTRQDRDRVTLQAGLGLVCLAGSELRIIMCCEVSDSVTSDISRVTSRQYLVSSVNIYNKEGQLGPFLP